MTNRDILNIALSQSAADSSCSPEDFISTENKVVFSKKNENARRYLELPFLCDLCSYGTNVVASVSPELEGIVRSYIGSYKAEYCFEVPNLHVLMDALRPLNMNACFMAEYFLPDLSLLKLPDCPYELRLMYPEDFEQLYIPQWSNALCARRKELDMLGVGAYDGDKLIGLAGCSADCDTMWQIGIDVLPEYRRQGIASALTTKLAMEVLERGKVPFYCCAWSNIKSARNAIKSGFKPAWVQLTVKNNSFIDEMNKCLP